MIAKQKDALKNMTQDIWMIVQNVSQELLSNDGSVKSLDVEDTIDLVSYSAQMYTAMVKQHKMISMIYKVQNLHQP